MRRVLVLCLLVQTVVFAENNSTQLSPAGVTYVDGKAPDELKAGPARKSPTTGDGITHAAFIRSGSRDVPKDDEIENEEFERFIKEHHRPTIETVFVSASPAPAANPDEDSEAINEESADLKSQAEFFKRPEKLQTFERSVALPTILPPADHHTIYSHPPHDLGLVYHTDGGHFSGFGDGQYVTGFQDISGGGQLFQVSSPNPTAIPISTTLVPRIISVPHHALKTKTYEIRRPAIQKHYYDIEERVIIRPAGSIVVELDRPVAKIPTGETIVPLDGSGLQQSQGGIGIAVGGGQGGLSGVGIQQSQGGQGQGGIGISAGGLGGVGIQQSQGGQSQGGIGIGSGQGGASGVGVQQSQGGIGLSQGGLSGVGFGQSQGGIGVSQGGAAGVGVRQSQGGIGIAQGGGQGGLAGAGVQQSQSGLGISAGGASGVGIQQSQGGAGISQGGPQGGFPGTGVQQSQSGLGIAAGGASGVGVQQSQGGLGISQGGLSGAGVQQSQSGVGIAAGGVSGVGLQQSQGGVGISQGGTQGGLSGAGVQQSQSGIGLSTGGPQGGATGVGLQQSQGGVGISQGGPQGGLSGAGVQQSQSGIGLSTGGPQGGATGVGLQQSQGGVGISQGGPQGGLGGVGVQQSQSGIGISTSAPQGFSYSTSYSTPATSVFFSSPQQGFGALRFQPSPGDLVYSTVASPTTPSVFLGQGGYQQSQGGIGIAQGGSAGIGLQQSQGGITYTTASPTTVTFSGSPGVRYQQVPGGVVYSTTISSFNPGPTPTPTVFISGPQGVGIQQSQGGIGIAQGAGGVAGVGLQQSQGGISYSTTATPFPSPSPTTPSILLGGPQGGASGVGIQQSQSAVGVAASGSGVAGVGIQQSQSGIAVSTTPAAYLPPVTPRPTIFPGVGGGVFSVSTTAGSAVTTTPIQQTNRDDSIVVEARTNVQNRGTFSSTTTTEKSFSTTVNQDASTYAKGTIQSTSNNARPFTISVGEPNFNYPPYVEINSRGSPSGNLQAEPYARIQESEKDYPRMRYQGQLLTGEIRTDEQAQEQQQQPDQNGYGALSQTFQQANFEAPSEVSELPPLPSYHDQQEVQKNKQYTQQSFQAPETTNGVNQQPYPVYQYDFVRTQSQPVRIRPVSEGRHTEQQNQHTARYQNRPHLGHRNLVAEKLRESSEEQQNVQQPSQPQIAAEQPRPIARFRGRLYFAGQQKPIPEVRQEIPVTEQPAEVAEVKQKVPQETSGQKQNLVEPPQQFYHYQRVVQQTSPQETVRSQEHDQQIRHRQRLTEQSPQQQQGNYYRASQSEASQQPIYYQQQQIAPTPAYEQKEVDQSQQQQVPQEPNYPQEYQRNQQQTPQQQIYRQQQTGSPQQEPDYPQEQQRNQQQTPQQQIYRQQQTGSPHQELNYPQEQQRNQQQTPQQQIYRQQQTGSPQQAPNYPQEQQRNQQQTPQQQIYRQQQTVSPHQEQQQVEDQQRLQHEASHQPQTRSQQQQAYRQQHIAEQQRQQQQTALRENYSQQGIVEQEQQPQSQQQQIYYQRQFASQANRQQLQQENYPQHIAERQQQQLQLQQQQYVDKQQRQQQQAAQQETCCRRQNIVQQLQREQHASQQQQHHLSQPQQNNHQQHVAEEPVQQQQQNRPQPVYNPQHVARPNAHSARFRSRTPASHPNLVAETRHQTSTEVSSTESAVVQEITPQQVEIGEVQGSTHRVFLETPSTTRQPESYTSGRRIYAQRGTPSKYTQARIYSPPQNLEVSSPEPQPNVPESTLRSNIESSTAEAVVSSTTAASAPQDTPHNQFSASVLAASQPGIVYASPGSPQSAQHSLRFSSEGSSLFSPSGRQLNLAYSNPTRAAYTQQSSSGSTPPPASELHVSIGNQGSPTHQRNVQLSAVGTSNPQQSRSHSQNAVVLASTTPEAPVQQQKQTKTHHKYRNEQVRGALTLRSGRTYEPRVIASTPAPKDAAAASESVQTRRIVVNHPFQTIQEVVEQEPITKYRQVTVNEPAPVSSDDPQQVKQSAAYRRPAAYKLAATYNHPAASLSFHHGGQH